MTTQVNLGVGVVDNTQSGLSSAERNISKFSKKSIKQLELEAKVSFPSIAGQIDGLEKNFSALKRKLGKFQFSGMRVGKKGNILGDMLFDAREIRGSLSTDVTKGLLDNLKAIQKGLSTGSVKSNNILGIDTAKEIKKINELIAALETYNKQMKVIERAWGAQDTAKIQAEKRKAYSAEFEEARRQKKDDELFRRRWAHEFGQWDKKDAELARLQREADKRSKNARIDYDRQIKSKKDSRNADLDLLREMYKRGDSMFENGSRPIQAPKNLNDQLESLKKQKEENEKILAVVGSKTKADKAYRKQIEGENEVIKKQILLLEQAKKQIEYISNPPKGQFQSYINGLTNKPVDPDMEGLKAKLREEERVSAKRAKEEAESNKESERQFKSRINSKRNAADIEIAIDNERAARDKANQTHSDRTVENINKEIAALKELRKAENDLDRAQGKKSRNARHDSDTNQRIKLLEQEAEAAKKSAEERKKADKDATDAARRHAKSRRDWIKKEKALMKKLGGLILRAFSVHQIIQFGHKVADVTGYFQQQQVALEGILGSATKARSVLNDITNFALKSPFRTDELVRFTKQLSAFGIGSDELFPTVTKLADISAGLGVDMDRIILAYGQVRSASVLRGQELRQFTEAGIPMVDALAKKFEKLNGEVVTTADVFELISERKVSFEMVSDVLSDMTEEGGKFYKMQEELTDTLAGQMSKLKDMWNLALNDMGKSGGGILNAIIKLLQQIVKDTSSVATGLVAAFATPVIVRALTHFKALNRLLRMSLKSVKGIGAGIVGLASGAIALAVMKLIKSSTELKRAFEDIEASFRKETDKMLSGLDSLVRKLSKAKVGTKEFADAVDTLSANYGDFVSDDIITKLKAQDEISEKLAKNFGETANNIREAIIELKKFQELEEKRETVADMFLREKTEGKVFRNWMRNNKLGTSDMTNDAFKSMYGRDARNNRELLDIWDELYDDAVTLFATGEDLSKEEFKRIFTETIKETFPEISEEELLRVVKLGWQVTSQNTGTGFNNLYNDLVDSQNRITHSDYYKLQKTFEDWTKEYKDSEDFVEKQNNMEAAYFKALRDSVVGKFGENDLTRALESTYGMQDGKVIATNFDNQSVNNILKVIEEFESTITDEKAKTWFSEAKKLFKEGVEDKSDRAAIVSDRMEAHEYLTNEIVSGLWRQYIPDNKTYKALREKIKSDYAKAKTELDSYVGDDPKDKKRKDELNKIIDALTILASQDFYAVDLTDKKGSGNKYERIRITNFFDDLLSLITKAEDEMKKIVGVTGYTESLGNFVNSLSPDNFLKAFFEEGGNPFKDILAKMTEYGITDFLPNFDEDTLKNIFRNAGWEEGKEMSIPDFKAMYEQVIKVVGDQVLEGLKTRRDQYAKGSSERNSLDSAIKSLQEQQAKSIKTMTTRWGGDEIEKKINLAIKELTNIGSKLDDIKSQRSMYERISKSSNPLIAKNALPDVSGYFSDSRYTSAALREMLRSEGGAGIASTLVGERLKSLLNGGSLNIDNLSALFEIIRDLEEQAGEKEITLADGSKIANSDQFKETTSKVVDIINKLVESILNEYDKLAQYKTGDLKISDEILQAAEDFKNALKEIEETEKDPKRAASMKLSATQQYYDRVLKSLGGSEMPDWIKTMFGKEGAFGGISDSGRFMKSLSGGSSLLDMIIQGKASDINKLYESGKFGDVGSAEAMQGAADELASAASSAAGSIAMVDAIIKAVYQAINAVVELGKGVLEVDAKVNNKLNLRKGANGKLYDKDGNINIDDNYYKKQDQREIANQAFDIISNFNNHIMGGWEKLKSGDIFGAITETSMAIADLIGDILGVGDTKLRQKQDELIRSNERLTNAMNSLEHALSLSVGNEKYDIYKEKASKLREQQLLYEQLLDLENQKKNGDDEKAQDYASQAKEAGEQLETLLNDFKTEVLGTADELANTLTDALVGAFREGTNAARAWRNAVRSYIGDILKQELMTKIIAPQIDKIMDSFFGTEELSSDEVKDLFSNEDNVLAFVDALNKEGTNLIDVFENLPQSLKDLIAFNGDTSALSGGISGITEDTARTLEGLANSMLMQMILANRELSTISQSGFAQVQVSWFNDMLQQARATRVASEQIKQILDETRNGVRPLKVEVM